MRLQNANYLHLFVTLEEGFRGNVWWSPVINTFLNNLTQHQPVDQNLT